MVMYTSSQARANIAEVLEEYKNANLDTEFKLIMQRHGKTIKALTDR